MKLTIVEKNFLSWTAMHIDFVMCNKGKRPEKYGELDSVFHFLSQYFLWKEAQRT